jgi:uncharacterized protein (DUF58 family)
LNLAIAVHSRAEAFAPRARDRVLVVLAAVAYVLARSMPWPVAVAIALAAFVAVVVYDALLLRGEVEIIRVVPARFALARRDELSYEIANRATTARRVAIVEAQADRLSIELGEARAALPARSRATVTLGVVPLERGRTALRSYHARILSALGDRRAAAQLPRSGRAARDARSLRARPQRRSGRAHQAARVGVAPAAPARRRRRVRELARVHGRRRVPLDRLEGAARRGKPMVAQYEVERSQQIVVALDAGPLDVAAIGRPAQARLRGQRGAGHGRDRAAGRRPRRRVAFAAGPIARVAPVSGAQHAAQLTDVLSDLEPRFEESDYERAFLDIERTLRRRSLVVLFTDLFDPIASSAVLGATRSCSRAAPRAHRADERRGDRAGAARDAAATPRDAYRAAVAATLADERARAVAVLRDRGILVVDVPAAELTVALLDAYVDVKTRGLL